MKKICFLLFIFSQFVYGQKSPYDNLEQRLAAEKTDTVKLKLLTELVNVAFTKI